MVPFGLILLSKSVFVFDLKIFIFVGKNLIHKQQWCSLMCGLVAWDWVVREMQLMYSPVTNAFKSAT